MPAPAPTQLAAMQMLDCALHKQCCKAALLQPSPTDTQALRLPPVARQAVLQTGDRSAGQNEAQPLSLYRDRPAVHVMCHCQWKQEKLDESSVGIYKCLWRWVVIIIKNILLALNFSQNHPAPDVECGALWSEMNPIIFMVLIMSEW